MVSFGHDHEIRASSKTALSTKRKGPLRARRFLARLSGYRLIPCDPVLRDRERAIRHDARNGYGTNISIPRSIVTPWPRSNAGLRKMASNTCALIRAQFCVRTRRSCSLLPKTTGVLRDGWHSLDGSVLLRTRVDFSLPSVGGLDRGGGPPDACLQASHFPSQKCAF
jgi:hypothetical protein